jgi:hypothetical protein
MAAIDNPDAGLKDIDKMSGSAKAQGRSCRGFNLFQEPDDRRFLTLGRGEWSISGVRAADLRATMPDLSPSQSSYLLKRLRTHGLIKQVGRRDTYYLTTFGRRVLAASLKIREYFVLPALCADTV